MQTVDARATALDLWGYDRATLILAWTYDKTDGVRLLFGRIELRPTELGRAAARLNVIDGVMLPGRAGRRVYAGVAEMSAADAVSWYEQALSGSWHVPGALAPGRTPPPHQPLGTASAEPVWPQMNLLVRPYGPLPCVPPRLECPRVHHRLVASSHPTTDAWTENERAAASLVLAPVVGFSLAQKPYLWESVRLVLPNPVLRSVGTQHYSRGTDEDLGVTLIARRHASLADLHVAVWEERDGLLLPLAQFRPSEARTLIRLQGIREAIAMTVDHDRLGRILVTDASPFIGALGLTMNLITMRRAVTAERAGKAPVSYETNVYRNSEHSVIGAEKPQTTVDLLCRERVAAEERHRAASEEEIWFSGRLDEAQAMLRKLVERAAKRVWVVDYFFGAGDAFVLLPAISALNAEIRVLTSREGLGMARSVDISARTLDQTANRLRADFQMQPIEIRVMPGKHAEIHDRFLVVDDRVYLLGSSINNYGARGTMLVRLRTTATVLMAIEEAWTRAQPLSEAAAAPTRSPPRATRTRVGDALVALARRGRAYFARLRF